MKTIIRLLVILPLLSLGGCYTQFALRDYDRGNQQDDQNVDQYAYEDQDQQADSTDNYVDNQNYPYDNDYYYNNFGYRRYLYDYYPSLAFSMGWGYGFDLLNRDHFFYGLYGQDYYGGYPGYYWPWYYGNYGYSSPYYNNYNPYWYDNNSQGIYKYRTYSALRTRNNDGERGTAGRYRDLSGGDRSRSSSGYVRPGTNNDRAQDVDLGKSRVSRGTDTKSDGTRVYKAPNSSNNTSRERASSPRTRDRNGSRATDNSSNRVRERTSSDRGSSGNSTRSSRAPSYTPRGETNRAPSYSPPSSSSGSSSGRSSSGSERGSSGSGSSERKR